MKHCDVLIIGGGPVGLYGNFLSNYLKLKTILIESDQELGGVPRKIFPNKTIPNFPFLNNKTNDYITGEELIKLLLELNKKHSNEFIVNQNITSIQKMDNECFDVILDNNEIIRTKFIIFTIGKCSWKFREIDKELIDNTKKIDIHYVPKKFEFYDKKNVLILGGGDSAIDYALSIDKNSKPKSISIIHHKENFSSKNGDFKDFENTKIKLLFNYKIQKIKEKEIIINHNASNENFNIQFDTILVQYGTELINTPNIIDILNIDNNSIIVDNNYMTSVNGIFAAGSCIKKENRINMIMTGISEITIILNNIKALLPNTEKVFW